MRKLLFIVAFAISVTYSSAQNNYSEYFQLMNKAKLKYNEKNFDSSFVLINRAFSMVDFVHWHNLDLGIKVAKKVGDSQTTKKFKDQKNANVSSINKTFKNYLDSISREDQRIRANRYMKARDYYYEKSRGGVPDSIKDVKFEKSKRLMEKWWYVDSMNIRALKKFIKTNGFPGEKIVGSETNNLVGIILLHYDRDTANHIMKPILDSALASGDILPEMYGWIIDRHLMNVGKEQIYYTIPFGIESLSKEKRQEVNNSRLSIGMKSLDNIRIVKKKNSVRVYYE